MKTIFPHYPLAIILAPLVAGLVIGPFGGWIGKKVYRIGVLANVLAFGLALCLLYDVIALQPQIVDISPRIAQWGGVLQLRFYIDRLAAVMMVHILAISTLINIFSRNYMQQERGFARFYSLLALSTFALLGMVASANLLMLFVFWQLLSALLSFLSYNYTHSATVRGAFRTFVMLRFGDVAFLGGIVLANMLYGTLDMQQLPLRAPESLAGQASVAGWATNGVTLVTLLIFIAAMTKSAQFPLHMWLPDSLYAPTPVHALLHAGIINACGFLINRLAPLFGQSPATLHVAFVVGATTALLGAGMMLTQNDIKRTLGFSTIGQMGYMIMECGLGAFSLAVFHLIAHGLFKATVFLNCGNVIHKARQEPHFPPMDHENAEAGFSRLTWSTGFVTTLFIPLLILLVTHGILRIPLLESQGTVIILFFIWITSSQAILTLTRLRAVASWKVSAIMLLTLLFIVFVYLFAVESFTAFLYPNPEEVASYFKAADLQDWLFDLIVLVAAFMTISGWTYLYMRAHGRTVWLPAWIEGLRIRLYTVFLNRIYADELYQLMGSMTTQLVHRIDKLERGWSR